jgi:TatD DNase family protein
MKLFDTHCHVHFNAFKADALEVIKDTLEKGVFMNLVGTQKDTSTNGVATAEKYEGTYASVGLHPVHLISQYVDEEESSFRTREEEFDYEYYKKLAQSPKTIAIGECGLDLYRIPEDMTAETVLQKQIPVFRAQYALAQEMKLPLAIHVRDAYAEMIEVLKIELNERSQSQVRGVIHCYISNWKNAEEFLKLGLYLGFTGIITFPPKKSDPQAQLDLWEAVRNCPLDRIVLETDSPYLAPGKYRGKRAEPWMVGEVARKIAEIKGITFEEVANQTTLNAQKLFNIYS